MTASNWTDFSREVVWIVEIDLDRCNNVFGTAPCAAVATRR